MDKNILALALVLLLAVFGYALFLFNMQASVCGNDVCESDETCKCTDCKCEEGQYCSNAKCVAPVCDNNICEPFEKPTGCCVDCECWGEGEICVDNKCVVKKFALSDERVKGLVEGYFQDQGKDIASIDMKSLITIDNKLCKNVLVKIKDEDGFYTLVVTEDEKVIDKSM